jgi:elongation factor P hydroxylase
MIAENKVVCTNLVHNHNTDGSSILKQQINNSVKRKAQEDICERPAKLIHQIANATQDCSDETVDMRALENIRKKYLCG